MATGAGEQYWQGQALPSMFKHTLLGRYVPQFAGMTASRNPTRGVVFLDGYAGRGRYHDGKPGSAELILQIARDQGAKGTVSWTCFFVERDAESAAALAAVVAEYSQVVRATARHGDVVDQLADVLATARDLPLFLFLDPCGLGVPYQTLVDLLGAQRAQRWPPTEVLVNFSLEAVRRIGGHITSPQRNEQTVARLDAAVGGAWWHEHFANGVSDDAVQRVVHSFGAALARDTRMKIASTPVRRAPGHKPVYHLIFGTRSNHGVWLFGDTVARATQAWWDTLEEVEAEHDPSALFSATSLVRPDLATVEKAAVPAVAENIAELLRGHASFKVVDHASAVFGSSYGQVRETVVRAAVNLLVTEGRATTPTRASKPRDVVVRRP